MTYFEEMNADGMFEELGYYKRDNGIELQYRNEDKIIIFDRVDKTVSSEDTFSFGVDDITMKELQAINKKCVELGWLKE